MKKTLYLTVMFLALAVAGAARADEQAATRAIIEKAIQARGGEDKLAQMKGMTFKSKGKLYGMGEGMDYTGEWAIQPPDKIRFQINFEANGMKPLSCLFSMASRAG
jgi:hypothetical protein